MSLPGESSVGDDLVGLDVDIDEAAAAAATRLAAVRRRLVAPAGITIASVAAAGIGAGHVAVAERLGMRRDRRRAGEQHGDHGKEPGAAGHLDQLP